MPKCFDCGKEQPILKSLNVPGEMMGHALCDTCAAKVIKEGDKNGKQPS